MNRAFMNEKTPGVVKVTLSSEKVQDYHECVKQLSDAMVETYQGCIHQNTMWLGNRMSLIAQDPKQRDNLVMQAIIESTHQTFNSILSVMLAGVANPDARSALYKQIMFDIIEGVNLVLAATKTGETWNPTKPSQSGTSTGNGSK